MKVWIVGKRGLVARTLLENAEQKMLTVVATSHEEVDIRDEKQIAHFVEEHHPTHIVNTAAYTQVDQAEAQREAAYLVNAIGPENLAKVAKRHALPLLHLSTDYVFDGKKKTPYQETDPCHPLNVYGKSKREGEERVLAHYEKACILRTAWLFKEGGNTFLSTLLKRLKEQKELQVVSDQTGSPTYCVDLAEAIWNLLPFSGIFHFANRGACSRFEFALFVKEKAEKQGIPLLCQDIIPIVSHFPAPRPSFSALDTHKYETVLGKTPRKWEEATMEFIRHGT